MKSLLKNIKRLLNKIPQKKFFHILRSQNLEADQRANQVCQLQPEKLEVNGVVASTLNSNDLNMIKGCMFDLKKKIRYQRIIITLRNHKENWDVAKMLLCHPEFI